jgi:uncharacterized repeat protein (TIGR03803 family)
MMFILLVVSCYACRARAQQFQVIHEFVANPSTPVGGLIQGSDGYFYGTTEIGGVFGVGAFGSGTVFKITPAGQVTTLHSFGGGDGAYPFASLVEGSDGSFYGNTFQGGTSGHGVIFKINPSGVFVKLHDFAGSDGANPVAPLIQASDGQFYGSTYFGGAHNQGTIFRMDSAGNVTTLYSFAGSDGSGPEGALLQASDGNFYGTTALGGTGPTSGGDGTIFKMTPAGSLMTIYSFALTDGENPLTALVEGSDGSFYGTTWAGGLGYNNVTGTTGNGTLFKITPSGTLTTLHFFLGEPLDPANPQATLKRSSDGNFYGVSETGGMNNVGTIYKADASGNVTVLHSFAGSSDGELPLHACLVQATDGKFYGTASAGGPFNLGTVFDTDSLGNFNLIALFDYSDASNPYAGVIQARDGNFYGTTYTGGPGGSGSIFKIDPDGKTTVLHFFTGSDGAIPTNLIQASDGNLYGTTESGGANNNGTIFKIDSAGSLTTLHSFAGIPVGGLVPGTEGSTPFGALLEANDGSFYGTTIFGGTSNDGTTFKITPSGVFTTLHSFSGTDGSNPYCALIQASDGYFYGTTEYGGAGSSPAGSKGNGTMFKMDSSGNLTSLHSFTGFDGAVPIAGLIQATDGNFYGTASGGGSSGQGSVFRMDAGGNVTAVYSFSGADGSDPVAALMQGRDGNLYGTTYLGGSDNKGTVFKLTRSGQLTILHSFDGVDGSSPYGGLTLASNGDFYGTTFLGGPTQPSGFGLVFRITPAPVQLNKVVSRMIHDSTGTFDIDLTTGNGIECRSGSSNGSYTLVFTFANPVANVGSASVTGGIGSVAATNIDSNDAHNYVVNLTGVTNAQRLTITLTNLTDSAGDFSQVVTATMGVLIGDVNASSRVDAADVSSVRQQTLQPVDGSNFRNDINASGRIDAADVSIARQQTLTSLP